MPVFIDRFPAGAQLSSTGVSFRVWAPDAKAVEVVAENGDRGSFPLQAETSTAASDAAGWFSGEVAGLREGALYRFQLDGRGPYPDPVSRFQPQGPHGPSMVVDPQRFQWSESESRREGVELDGQVIYELHIGTFTTEGTFDAAVRELPELAELGITMIEILPIAEFPGRFNWGYDGVDLYAPFHGYGDYDALKRFVDAAHREGIAVILDVVYNHIGPDGNYLACFAKGYFTDRYVTEWGEAINFDGDNCASVREHFIANAAYWIREFHLDGLRLDATQSIFDSGTPHVIAEITARARAAAHPRKIVVIAENEPQNAVALRSSDDGGYELDGMWNDDFHHSARVALTGRQDGYFHDHRGRAQEFVSAAKHGFLYQGQYYSWQKQPRGKPALDIPPCSFVVFIQNHDQVGNTYYGVRIDRLASPARLRAMKALLLLGPQTPMLFMGEEFGASNPFTFFADHEPELAALVFKGRREFMRQFVSYATPDAQAALKDPASIETFNASKLDFSERETHAGIYALHRDLLKLRRQDPVLSKPCKESFDGATLSEHALLLRWFDAGHGDRLLVVNFGTDLNFSPGPEPLLAPPLGARWALAWSSESPRYGGMGVVNPCMDTGWCIPGESAALFVAADSSRSAGNTTIRTGG